MRHIQIHIQGSLKDTGYMYFIKQIATLYGINGFARYKKDGSIRVSAVGEKNSLEKFTQVARIGTYNTRIDQFETVEASFENFQSFDIQ